MKTKQQLITELNCLCRRLKQLENEVEIKRDARMCSWIGVAKAYTSYTKDLLRDLLPRN